MTTANINLTEESKRLFLAYAADAGDWGGEPLLDSGSVPCCPRALRGYLTDWKVKGLAESFVDDGDAFLIFTDAGRAFAAANGITIA